MSETFENKENFFIADEDSSGENSPSDGLSGADLPGDGSPNDSLPGDGSPQDEVNKVFVGNVPYQCTREEFQDCFKDMEGFVNADIIRRYKSKLTRGFGFVVFETKEQSDTIMKNDTIELKDRILRFSEYSFDKPEQTKEGKVYQVFVNNLKAETTENQFNEALSHYGNLSSSVITSKNDKTFGVAAFELLENYKNALYETVTINDTVVELVPYIDNHKKYQKFNKYKSQRKFSDKFNNSQNDHFSNCLPRDVYREGFKAGHIVGFEEGLKQGLKQGLTQGLTQGLAQTSEQTSEQNLK